MPSDFRQTSSGLRSDRDRGRRSLAVFAVVGVLLGLATLWVSLARVPIYAVSEFARLQARDEVHPVDTLVSGRVMAVSLPVGGRVRRGDVLIALDASDVALRLEEAQAAERGLTAQIAALGGEIQAREDALATTSKLGQASRSAAVASRTETQAEAKFAGSEVKRADSALKDGVVAAVEAERAATNLAQKQAALSVHDHQLDVLSSETARDLADRRAANEGLRRLLASLSSDRDRASVLVKRLEVERARHTVVAPIDGVLGQVRAPQVGSVVAVGQTVAVVTPESALELVADFAPAHAIARVHAGQRARMRVTGFPWTQYGMLDATVVAVSSEVADGRIRVRLALDDQASAIPRRHGLIGEVEIELAQVSPATLLARAAGAMFEPDEPPATPAAEAHK